MGASERIKVVAVAALSDGVNDDKLDMRKSRKVVKSWGLDVKYAPGVFNQIHDFQAGSIEERHQQLRWLGSQKIKLCINAEGGYAMGDLVWLPKNRERTMELIERWGGMFMGYSDVGWLACAALRLGMKSIYGPNFAWLHRWDQITRDLTEIIIKNNKIWEIGSEFNWTVGTAGHVKGTVVVGNLEVLIGQFRTRNDWLRPNKNIILCLEENGLSSADIMRKLQHLFAHKYADSVKGLVLGRMTEVKNGDYPKYSRHVSLRDDIVRMVRDFSSKGPKIPVAFLDDFGHMGKGYESETTDTGKRQIPMIFGAEAELEVSRNGCSLCYREPLWK